VRSPPSFGRPIKGGIEMLQRAAAATAEMSAGGIGAPGPGGDQFDDPALAPSSSGSAEPGANAVSRRRIRQKNRRALVFGDAVSACPQPIDDKLDEFAAPPVLRDGAHQAMG
jgi:hypothetical protein